MRQEGVFYIIFFSVAPILCNGSIFSLTKNMAPFLPQKYSDISKNKEYWIRQVPGAGSCLFDAITVSYLDSNTTIHQPYNKAMKSFSKRLRQSAVETLLSNVTLPLANDETIPSQKLLELTALEYNISPSEYCQLMLNSGTWGGGPEILAITQLLKRPINIFEVCCKENDPNLYLSKTCTLGSCSSISAETSPLNILFADGRFPDISPAEVSSGHPNHFLAVFEKDESDDEQPIVRSAPSLRHSLFSGGGKWKKGRRASNPLPPSTPPSC
jgi:hypothetical protein